jgi:hypothetical protein
MTTQSRQPQPQPSNPAPALPAIGKAESYYTKLAQQAEAAGDPRARAAAKVGQYVTLAVGTNLPWEEKAKYFRHALKRHCTPPAFSEGEESAYYHRLGEFVRQYAGQEALRMASETDDFYAARLAMGQARESIEDEAEAFFGQLIGTGDPCPDIFNRIDWEQIKLIRDQWI